MRAAVVCCLLLCGPATAGVFSPAEPCPFEVANGVAKPLPHGRFKSLLNERRFQLNPALPEYEEIDTPAGKQRRPTPRGQALARVREMAARLPQLTPDERLTHSADLIHTGTLGREFAALKKLTGERPRDYRLAANYAHAETLVGNWSVAARGFEDHVLELDPPTEPAGTKPDQLQWLLSVEKGAYRKWLRARLADAGRKAGTDGDVYPLFPGVTFGGHELPPAEKAKLPADAVAVVQQLALWSPTDTGLLWLLAELYAATGQLREADDAFDMCTWGAGMTGQKKLMEHRKEVKSAVDKLPPPAPEILTPTGPPPEPDAGFFGVFDPNKLWLVGGGFGLVVVALLTLQVRAIVRRKGRRIG